MGDGLFTVVRTEVNCWDVLGKYDLFERLGLNYSHALILGQHPIVKFLDPESQRAHFESRASTKEKTMNEAALDTLARGKTRYPVTYVVDIGCGFGYGLFAGEDIVKGTFIGEYSGLLTWKGFQPVLLAGGFCLGDSMTPYDMSYLMAGYNANINPSARADTVFSDLFKVPEASRLMIDASQVGGDTRFINHLSRGERFYRPDGSVIDGPNVEVVQGCHQGYYRKWVFAKQEIKRGEELRLNYSNSYWQREHSVSRLFYVSKLGLCELHSADRMSIPSEATISERNTV